MRQTAKIFASALTIAIIGVTAAVAAGVEHSVTGVGGYDVVSYRTGEKPLPGNGNHLSEVDGVTYLFISEKNKDKFDKNPQKYLPAYGGYCAFGASVGKKFVGDPNVWEIVDDQLYLNLDNKIKGVWAKDIPGNIRKANEQWPKIRDQHFAAL